MFLLSVIYFAITTQAQDLECIKYLNSTKPSVVHSIFDTKYAKNLNPAATVMIFIDRFNYGKNLKIEELHFIMEQLSQRNVLTTYEAKTGLEIAKGFYEAYGMREELVFKSVITFSFRLFELKNDDFGLHLRTAKQYVEEYVKFYPESRSATVLALKLKHFN